MRTFVIAATVIMLAGNAAAQSSPQDLDRLKRLLDEKLGSTSQQNQRTRGMPADKPTKPDDFYVVQPDGTIRDTRGLGPQKRSAMGGEVAALLGGIADLTK